MNQNRIALIETKPSRTNFKDMFDRAFEFDQYQLCSKSSIKKILKADCDINFDESQYDWIILVGSDALKYFTKITSITDRSGSKIGDKFLAIINPAMLAFKPEIKPMWEKSKANIIGYITGTLCDFEIDSTKAIGIQDTQECNDYIRAAIDHPNTYVALDSETTGLYPRDGYILGISLSYKADHGAYIDVECFDQETEELLQELFTKKLVIFHNAKFDIAFFEYHFNFRFPRFADTMLLHYLLDENPGGHGLKQLAIKYTKYGDYEKPMYEWIEKYCRDNKILKADFNWGYIPFETMKTYASVDAIVTLLLFHKFNPPIRTNTKLSWVYDNILIPGTRFLTDVQDNGVPFDLDRLEFSRKTMQESIDGAIVELYKYDEIQDFERVQGKDFNPNSVLQLRALLFDYLGLQPSGKKTGTGQHSTDAEVLEELATQSPVPAHILKIKKKSKIKNTYLDKIILQLDRDGYLRTGFNLHTTTSGRLSSSGKLNMQQLPRDEPTVKGCIKAKPGHKIVAMDLKTAEVYVAAVLANDKVLQALFKRGGDFHSAVAHKVFNLPCAVEDVKSLYPMQRQAAKAITFGIMYGAQAQNISEQITKETGVFCSPSEAQGHIDDYFAEFHKLAEWIQSSKDFIATNGFVYSFFGRKRRLGNVKSTDRAEKSHSIRSGLNFLVQSTASDVNLLGSIDANEHIKAKGMKAKIFALVHDSVLAEVPEDEVEEYCKILVSCIQLDRGLSIPGCPIPCDIDIADDYSLGKFNKLYGDNI